jgi:hypothetical protein
MGLHPLRPRCQSGPRATQVKAAPLTGQSDLTFLCSTSGGKPTRNYSNEFDIVDIDSTVFRDAGGKLDANGVKDHALVLHIRYEAIQMTQVRRKAAIAASARSGQSQTHGVPVLMVTELPVSEPDVAFNVIVPAVVVD